MVDRFFADAYLAGVYDAWHPRNVRDDYDFYLPHILAADAVLDVGCGTGTLLHEARQAGHTGRLCGIDPGSGMLDRARRRSDIEWFLGYFQAPGFTAEFDLIVMTGHAFQAIIDDEDLLDFLAAVRSALVPGGCFAFETRNPAARAWEQWAQGDPVTVKGPDGSPVRITTGVIAPYDGRVVTFTHSFMGEHPSLPQVSQSTLRFLDNNVLRNLLEQSGLQVQQQFGDFDARPLGPESPEIITFAMR
ncbi:class I SAM-dependent DNA methyltransferase [Chelativorans salis]|uniref:Class I SAM-dependent methyltransferase n=1 Tax=Chelativorans salis TaxID=2978478 RepID=A0ABT2LVT5_9HYPH|nr:class I SAM-dependent methyltransferase [Chelativorans sp. EGI FJ00035]MCT7378630.1 class I SAM-dependent methyltransferase [Chelativorans sp. EGI FJ00035]